MEREEVPGSAEHSGAGHHLGGLLTAVAILSSAACGDPSRHLPAAFRQLAVDQCQDAVEDVLHSQGKALILQPKVRRLGDARYAVRGGFEARGAAGTLECRLTDDGGTLEVVGISVADW